MYCFYMRTTENFNFNHMSIVRALLNNTRLHVYILTVTNYTKVLSLHFYKILKVQKHFHKINFSAFVY